MSSSLAARNDIQFRYPWMFGKAHDLFFFFFSLLIGIAICLFVQSSNLADSFVFAVLIPTAFGAGPFHQGPTWFMYFDEKNRAHYASTFKKKLVFFIAPPTIMLLSVLGMLYCRPLTMGIWLIWSIQHLVQQNIGILLLYHNPRANEVVVNRKTETLSQQIPAVLFTLILIKRTTFHNSSFILLDIGICAMALWTVFILWKYAAEFSAQIKEGKTVNVPALGFWGMSAACLFPLTCVGHDFAAAFAAPVIWHWFQYIGLNWRLVRKKYSGGSENANLPFSRPILLFLTTCFSVMLINLSLSAATFHPGFQGQNKYIIIGVLIGLVHIHYFLDAFMWRFREPYQRAAILPYLIDRGSPAVAASPVTGSAVAANSVAASSVEALTVDTKAV